MSSGTWKRRDEDTFKGITDSFQIKYHCIALWKSIDNLSSFQLIGYNELSQSLQVQIKLENWNFLHESRISEYSIT